MTTLDVADDVLKYVAAGAAALLSQDAASKISLPIAARQRPLQGDAPLSSPTVAPFRGRRGTFAAPLGCDSRDWSRVISAQQRPSQGDAAGVWSDGAPLFSAQRLRRPDIRRTPWVRLADSV